MSRRLMLFLLLTCAQPVAARADASAAVANWSLTGSGTTYRIAGGGNPLATGGAAIKLSSNGGRADTFGAAMTMLDATPFRQRTIRLSADLSTRDANEGGGALWLRADGPQGPLDFINSHDQPVKGSSSRVHREISLYVPSEATKLVLGLLLAGNGEVTASRLRLNADDKMLADSALPPQRVLDAAIEIVHNHALRAKNIDWETLEPTLRAASQHARTSADVHAAIRTLLAALGDQHSFLMESAAVRRTQDEGNPASTPMVDELPGRVGYVSMPAYSGAEPRAVQAFATQMIGAISRKARDTRCGWIVDLRENAGGNMWPMLAALRPFLGSTPVGSFQAPDGPAQPWNVEAVVGTLPVAIDLGAAPVAVLTGPRTASSGEAVAIAFRGRTRTRSFGAPTAGVPTGNTGFDLPDGSRIFLTTVVELDRNGRTYSGAIEPDQLITEGDPIVSATAWLIENQGCAQPKR